MNKTVCIDKGHCNITAALPNKMFSQEDQQYEIKRLVSQEKDQVILTQIVLTDQQMEKLSNHPSPDYELLKSLGKIQIGNHLPHRVKDGEKFIYFKVAPKDFDTPCGESKAAKENGITHGMIMACCMYALLDNILKYNIGDICETEREDLTILVGCPTTSDWTSPEAEAKYANLVQRATGVKEVKIIAESRAAVFSCIENGKNIISAVNGVVVFDFGSSTADCTYMLLGRKKIEFSWTLGAREIERLMVANALAKLIETKEDFIPDKESVLLNEDDMRTAKEKFFEGIYNDEDGHKIICEFKDINGNTEDSTVRINREFMEKITNENCISILCDSRTTKTDTWQNLCKEFFEEAKRQITNAGGTIENVVLTGGAGKMDFVKQLAEEVFGNDASIFVESNPSHTVSNGLGWIAVSEENLNTCKDAAKKVVEADEKTNPEILKNNLADSLFDLICDITEEKTIQWANKDGDCNLKQLKDDIDNALSSEDFNNKISEVITEKVNNWKSVFLSSVQNAVNSQAEKLYTPEITAGVSLPEDVWEEINSNFVNKFEISPDEIIRNIDVTSLIRKILKAVIILAFVLAGCTFGPIGAFVGGIVGSIIADNVNDENLYKPRKKSTRQKVANKIRHSMTKDIDTKIHILSDFIHKMEIFRQKYPDMLDSTLTKAFEYTMLKRFSEDENNEKQSN